MPSRHHRSRPRATVRRSVVAGLSAMIALGAAPVVAAPAHAAAVQRIGGADRIETAALIADRSFPDTAETVYLARSDDLADALVAGTLSDGPVLLVPRCGPVPDVVTERIDRLDPALVVALGGPASVCDDLLERAAGERSRTRVAGPDRFATAVAVAERRAGQGGVTEVYLARGTDAADAVAGGSLTRGPILLTPSGGDVPTSVLDEIVKLAPQRVVALGGSASVPDQELATAAGQRPTARLSGRDRYETSAAISAYQFPQASDTVYLAQGDIFADAVSAGSLTDGPVLLVPRCGTLPEAVRAELRRLAPDDVIALGKEAAVCEGILDQAVDAVPEPVNPNPVNPNPVNPNPVNPNPGPVTPAPQPQPDPAACDTTPQIDVAITSPTPSEVVDGGAEPLITVAGTLRGEGLDCIDRLDVLADGADIGDAVVDPSTGSWEFRTSAPGGRHVLSASVTADGREFFAKPVEFTFELPAADEIVINPETVELSADQTAALASVTDSALEFFADPGLAPGNVVVAEPGGLAVDGLLRRVTAVSTTNGITTVSTTAATATDVLWQVHFDQTVPEPAAQPSATRTLMAGATANPNARTEGTLSFDTENLVEGKLLPKTTYEGKGSIDLSVAFEVSAQLHLQFDVTPRFGWGWPSLETHFLFEVDDAEARIEATAAVQGDLDVTFAPLARPKPLKAFNIGPLIFVVQTDPQATLHASAGVKTTLPLFATSTFHGRIEVTDDVFRPFDRDFDFDAGMDPADMDPSAVLTGQVGVGIDPHLSVALYGSLGAGISTEFGVRAVVEAPIPALCPVTYDIEGYASATVFAHASVLGFFAQEPELPASVERSQKIVDGRTLRECGPEDPDHPQEPVDPNPQPALVVTTKSLPVGEIGVAYSQDLTASENGATWSIVNGALPTGMSLTAAGRISGTPTRAAASTVVVRAQTPDGRRGTGELQVTVVEPLRITTTALPAIYRNVPYSAQLQAAGGVPPYTWAVNSYYTYLPGMTLSQSGVFSGTTAPHMDAVVSYAGYFFKVTDARGVVSFQRIMLDQTNTLDGRFATTEQVTSASEDAPYTAGNRISTDFDFSSCVFGPCNAQLTTSRAWSASLPANGVGTFYHQLRWAPGNTWHENAPYDDQEASLSQYCQTASGRRELRGGYLQTQDLTLRATGYDSLGNVRSLEGTRTYSVVPTEIGTAAGCLPFSYTTTFSGTWTRGLQIY